VDGSGIEIRLRWAIPYPNDQK